MKSFIIKLTVLTLVIALAGFLFFALIFPEYYLPVLPFLLLFFYLVSLGIHAFLFNQAQKDIGKFTRGSMLVTVFKMFLYTAIAVVYVALNEENVVPFVISLMLLYIVYTFFEVREIAMVARSKRNNKKSGPS